VQDLQQRLKDLEYYQGPVDGVYDQELEGAVRTFQRDHDLTADAVVGDATWVALAGRTSVTATTIPKEKPTGQMRVVIDAVKLRLTLYVDGKPYKSYPVAVGDQKGFNWSPVGDWKIVNKGVGWGSGFGTRWMGLNVPWGIYGIHGTNKPYSIGSRASHGCIRMYNRDVEELYSWVNIGTPVSIMGATPSITLRTRIEPGNSGKDVVKVQQRLQQASLKTDADGRYGPQTVNAVKQLQNIYGLPIDGTVYSDVYYVLGLK
jgi:peptidoglycan hydrolase-like protein with peptidoglycan-binding domain